MANTYLSRNQTGNTYTRTWTLSWWFKRSKLGTVQRMWTSDDDASGNNDDFFQWQSDDSIQFGFYASGYYAKMHTNRKFRDTNAWYHCVFAWDSTQVTASDRIKVYINGVQETSWLASDYPSQNSNSFIGGWSSNLYPIECGRRGLDNTQHFDGSMSHCHFTDGTAYDASAFGSTDATTGEWVGNTSPSVTYGNNGFFILKDGNGITDQSGEGNDFTLGGGTLTDLKDNPDNTFATWNFLSSPSNGNVGDVTGSNGNTTTSTLSSGYRSYPATLGYTTGKFYWEIKRNNTTNDCHLGITNEDLTPANQATWIGNTANGWMYGSDGGTTINSGTDTNTGYSTSTTGDIIMVAHDATNGKLYFGKNGSWQGSSNPSTEASPAFTGLSTSKFWFPAFSAGSSNSANFGNGYFGTTAVATNSGNGYAGAEGSSIFNYQPPTGYSALSTKGLNT